MIKLQKKQNGKLIKDPPNLLPIMFKCRDCGCTIKKIEQTQSYILMNVPLSVETGKVKICPFCYRLRAYRGVE